MTIFWDTKYQCEAKEKQICEVTGARSQEGKPLERHWKPLEVKNKSSQRRAIGRVHRKQVIRSHRKNNNIGGAKRTHQRRKS